MGNNIFLYSTAPVGLGLLLYEVSGSHSGTPHPVGLLWTSDQPDAETSTCKHATLKMTEIHAPDGIRNHNLSKRAAADPRFRSHGHGNNITYTIIWNYKIAMILCNLETRFVPAVRHSMPCIKVINY